MTPNISALLNLPLLRAAYSDRTAWLMANCSALAYVSFEAGEEKKLSDSLQELGLKFEKGISRDATCAFLASNDRFAVLAFRGTTADFRNILTDIKIRFYRDKSGARLSTGFSEAYALVQNDIAAAVGALDPNLPLYITGHSLGGALAVIASNRIHPWDRIASCYTYGCPRVGNGEFANQLWKVPIYRQVHSSDIVPRVPLPIGYRHAGDMRYIKRSGDLVEGPNPIGTFFSFFYSALTGIKNPFLNHRSAGYVDALQDWALKRMKLDSQFQTASASAPAPTAPKTLSVSGGAQ